MSKKSSNSLFAFLFGAATGAVLGILYAPDKGSSTRDKLSYKLDKLKQTLEEILDDLVEGKEKINNEAKEEGEKIVNQAKDKAEKLLDDVNGLLEQIGNK